MTKKQSTDKAARKQNRYSAIIAEVFRKHYKKNWLFVKSCG